MKTVEMRRRTVVAVLALAVALGAACGESDDLPGPESSTESVAPAQQTGEAAAALVPDLSELNTFINDSIEIDELNGGPGDANLFSLAATPAGDPADGTGHALLPATGIGDYIDWDDLGGDLANHQLMDEFKSDSTSFPRKVECIAPSQVLSKMDLTYVAAANNDQYAYFAVQRRDNNGDAAWYWLMTKEEPSQTAGEAPCKADELRLTYDISGPTNGSSGDILIVGHFKPNAGPLVRIFHATRDELHVPAGDAIDFNSTLWVEQTPPGIYAAVNTTNTAPGALGAVGVDALQNGNLLPEIFAETGIPISVFNSGSACGASYFASIITRPSGSGGTSPDLKDLSGPAVVNFGTAEAEATMQRTCDGRLRYDVTTVTGANGQPSTDYTCLWTFTDEDTQQDLPTQPTTCDGVIDVPAGNYSASVTVSVDGGLACETTVDVASVAVYDPLVVDAFAAATCSAADNPAFESKVSYWGTSTGGSSDQTIGWAFEGTACPTCQTSPTSSDQLWSEGMPGSFDVDPANQEYRATLTVTDNAPAVLPDGSGADFCQESDFALATPFAPIAVDLSLTAAAQTCPSMTSDSVAYDAVATGGDGNYTYNWTPGSCAGASCIIDPSDSDFCHDASVYVMVGDGSGLCEAATSETETYQKITTVSASDNP